MDEPESALDPVVTLKIEELVQQAVRISDHTCNLQRIMATLHIATSNFE